MTNESDVLLIAGATKALRIPGVGSNFRELETKAKAGNWGYLRYLGELLAIELDDREMRKAKRLLGASRVPRTKLLSDFDLGASLVTSDVVEYLAKGEFIGSSKSVVLIGGPGTGKTHLLIGTLIAGASLGKRTRYVNAAALVNELVEAEDEKSLSRVIERYQRLDLLGIDELGYLHLDRRGAELLFQVITEREERSALMVATNLPFSEWNEIFPDPRLASAVVDRITFNSRIIETGSDSYRLRSALTSKAKKTRSVTNQTLPR